MRYSSKFMLPAGDCNRSQVQLVDHSTAALALASIVTESTGFDHSAAAGITVTQLPRQAEAINNSQGDLCLSHNVQRQRFAGDVCVGDTFAKMTNASSPALDRRPPNALAAAANAVLQRVAVSR
jgi:hypothetical protein